MDLYVNLTSPPSHAVVMTAKALGIELNIKVLDLYAGEHMTPEYLKYNPQHTIPTLVDGDFSIWESRAIMVYLVEQYGKENDPLYPSCPKKRALINQRLHFDMGTLYRYLYDYFHYQLKDKTPPNPEDYKQMEAALEKFNAMLEGYKYAAGDELTVADLSLLATMTTYEVAGFDFAKYPNIQRWYSMIKFSAPGADENWANSLRLKEMLDTLKK
uniref:Uncharacterized protein n=1 Tax=Stomoxys calcitrans TaxID=35570 RepID=A0A1I8PIY9_STOCA